MRTHRNIVGALTAFALLLVGVLVAGCTSKQDVARANASRYDADFAIVYSAALDSLRESYPNYTDDAAAGLIKTAWHQVKYSNPNDEDQQSVGVADRAQGQTTSGSTSSGTQQQGLVHKRYFIRFDISVTGGRPWRVRVKGHAAEWAPGNAIPAELLGLSRPHWLQGRIDAVTVDIYHRLENVARDVPAVAVLVSADDLPEAAAGQFGELATDATEFLARLKFVVQRREYSNLRALLASDVVWSSGAAPGADTAMVMWQADTTLLDTMLGALAQKCKATSATELRCPGDDLGPGSYQLAVGKQAGGWKVTRFAAQ